MKTSYAVAGALLYIAACLFFASRGHGQELQLEYGQCRFGQATDGTYYDSRLDHTNYLTPRCAAIAYAAKFKPTTTWGYRVAFLQSGSVEGRDNRAQMNDGYYDPNPCSTQHWANCHSLFGGSGRMRGISVSLTKDQRIGRHLWARGEVGAMFFEHFFNGYAKPADFDGSSIVSAGAIAGTALKWEGGGLEQKSSMWNLPLPLVGMTVGYKGLYFAARHHFPVGREGLSITDHSFTQITGGVLIKL